MTQILRDLFQQGQNIFWLTRKLRVVRKEKQVKLSLQRPAARYDGIGKIGGGYGSLVSMVT